MIRKLLFVNSQNDSFEAIQRIISSADPVGLLQAGAPDDEYDTESRRVATLFQQRKSVDDLAIQIHRIFCKMFDTDTAGPIEKYQNIAKDIWELKKN